MNAKIVSVKPFESEVMPVAIYNVYVNDSYPGSVYYSRLHDMLRVCHRGMFYYCHTMGEAQALLIALAGG